jgi:hypothetical protein
MSARNQAHLANPWTDGSHVPRDELLPDHKERRPRLSDEKRDWYLAEVRQRLGAKVTKNEVIGWLISESVDSQDITWLMTWAEMEDPPPMPSADLHFVAVAEAEVRSQVVSMRFGQGPTHIHTDPVLSARGRTHLHSDTEIVHDAPAPEFRFAQPADANEAWESQHAYDMGNVIKGMILVIVVVVIGLLALIGMMLW